MEPAGSTPAPARTPEAKQNCTAVRHSALAAAPALPALGTEPLPRQVHPVPWQPESTGTLPGAAEKSEFDMLGNI